MPEEKKCPFCGERMYTTPAMEVPSPIKQPELKPGERIGYRVDEIGPLQAYICTKCNFVAYFQL
jgi:hypothetical protein